MPRSDRNREVLAIDPASEDAAKVRPFIDEYQWENNVPVRIESVGLHTDFQTEVDRESYSGYWRIRRGQHG